MNSETLIIIIVFASLGLLAVVFVIFNLCRSLSATSNPLPPVQPLAHHRQSYYQLRHLRNNSKSSLLDEEYILIDPQPKFYQQDPRRLSSCSSTNTSSSRPNPRPTSIASSSRLSPSPSSGRRGLPHSPHSQMHIVLPSLLSGSASDSSIVATSEFGLVSPTPRPRSSSRPTSRHFLQASSEHDRRSSMTMIDRWLPTPDSYSLTTNYDTPPQRRTPSPLIPLSSSFSSLSQSQNRRSIPTTPSSSSPSNINITLDPATVSRPSIGITSDSSNPQADLDQSPTTPNPGDNINADSVPTPLQV